MANVKMFSVRSDLGSQIPMIRRASFSYLNINIRTPVVQLPFCFHCLDDEKVMFVYVCNAVSAFYLCASYPQACMLSWTCVHCDVHVQVPEQMSKGII